MFKTQFGQTVLAFGILWTAHIGHLCADEEPAELSLDSILNLKVTVASKKARTSRESPGVVTVVTEEEIHNMGARDLIDILYMIPGFSFNLDTQGVVGISFRGLWAHEGKVLLLIDDHEMTEPRYANLEFGNHYPADQIKQIEIIRGPGSVQYGGNAELAVIKITTKNADDLHGVQGEIKMGQTDSTYLRWNLSLQAGQRIGDLTVKAAAFGGRGKRSNKEYTDIFGKSYNMKDNADLDPLLFNFGIGYKGLEFSSIYDRYHTTY